MKRILTYILLTTTPISNVAALHFEANGTTTAIAPAQSITIKKYSYEFNTAFSIPCIVGTMLGIGTLLIAYKIKTGQNLDRLSLWGIGLGFIAAVVSAVCGVDTYVVNKI